MQVSIAQAPQSFRGGKEQNAPISETAEFQVVLDATGRSGQTDGTTWLGQGESDNHGSQEAIERQAEHIGESDKKTARFDIPRMDGSVIGQHSGTRSGDRDTQGSVEASLPGAVASFATTLPEQDFPAGEKKVKPSPTVPMHGTLSAISKDVPGLEPVFGPPSPHEAPRPADTSAPAAQARDLMEAIRPVPSSHTDALPHFEKHASSSPSVADEPTVEGDQDPVTAQTAEARGRFLSAKAGGTSGLPGSVGRVPTPEVGLQREWDGYLGHIQRPGEKASPSAVPGAAQPPSVPQQLAHPAAALPVLPQSEFLTHPAADEAHTMVGFASQIAGAGQSIHLITTTGPTPAPPPWVQIKHLITETAQGDSSRKTDLVLSPEELGRVRLEVTTQDDLLVIRIASERPETLDLLRRQAEHLLADLARDGFTQPNLQFGAWDQKEDQKRRAYPEDGSRQVALPLEPSPRKSVSGSVGIWAGRLNLRL